MTTAAQRLDAFLGRIQSGVSALAAIVCLIMAVHIVTEFSIRFIFNRPWPGTVAIVSNYYMIAVTFLPLAAVERAGGHISVELVTELFSVRVQRALMAIVWTMAAAVALLLTFASWSDAEKKREASVYVMESGYQLFLWPAYYLLPIGFGLLVLAYLIRIIGYFTDQKLGGHDQLATAEVHTV